MDYKKIYEDFILDRKNNEVDLIASGEYKEVHHIIPKSLNGSNESDNLVALSIENHIYAHWLLAKIHGGIHWVSVERIFSGNRKYFNPTKKMIEIAVSAKINAVKELSKLNSGNGNPFYGKTHTSEAIEKMKNKKISADTRVRIGLASKGRVHSANTKLKIGLALKNKIVSEETRLKMSKNNGMKRPEIAEKISGDNHHTRKNIDKVRLAMCGDKNIAKRPEVRKKLIENNKMSRKVICIETGDIYRSGKYATEVLGMKCKTAITAVCRGKRKTAGGYHWEYVDQAA